MSFLWSLLERVSVRFISAVLSLMLAAVQGPRILGIYTTVVTVVTMVQVVADISWRQTAAATPPGLSSARAARSTAVLSGLLGSALLLSLLFGIVAIEYVSVSEAWQVAPLAVVPVASSLSVPAVVHLQRTEEFRRLATAQAVSSSGAFALTLPLFLFTRNMVAPSLQFLIAEILLVAVARRAAGPGALAVRAGEAVEPRLAFVRRARGLSAYNFLSWAQFQLDRLGVVFFASAATVGTYAFAVNVGRVLIDLLVIAVGNVLRPRLAAVQGDPVESERIALDAARAIGAALSAAAVLTVTAIPAVLRTVFGNEWDESFRALPIMVLAGLPLGLSAIISIVLQAYGQNRKVIGPLVLSAALALPVSAASTAGVQAVCAAVLGRELLLMAVRVVGARTFVARSVSLTYLRYTAVGAGSCVVFMSLPATRTPVVDTVVAVVCLAALGVQLWLWRNGATGRGSGPSAGRARRMGTRIDVPSKNGVLVDQEDH